MLEAVKDLLFQEKMKNSVRLLGISLSNLNNEKKEQQPEPEESIDVQLKFDF